MRLKNGILEFDVLLERGRASFVQAEFRKFQWTPIVSPQLVGPPEYNIVQKDEHDHLIKIHKVSRWDYQKMCDILSELALPDVPM